MNTDMMNSIEIDEFQTKVNHWQLLANEILQGHALTAEEGLKILESSDEEILSLLHASFRIRSHYFGRTVQLYFLKNAKSGLCAEDCHYCSQSASSQADIPKYSMQDEATLLEGAKSAADSQAKTYCIVTSGRGPSDKDVAYLSNVVTQIKEQYELKICCCLGLLSADQAQILKQAGVDRINHNLNTSESFHESICSTHTYRDRLETLESARNAGLELCSGLIVGMGEQPQDVVDVALELQRLKVESIPVNFLHAIPGTMLEGTNNLNPRYCLKVLCLFRFANPATEIRIAGGREVQLRSIQPMGLYAANSLFVSDYLTTSGQSASEDIQMIEDLGFEVSLIDES